MKRIVIDVGASQGLFAEFIASRTTKGGGPLPSAMVYAVEPIEKIASRINRRPNLIVISKAILSKEEIPKSGSKALKIMQNSELSSFLEINPEIDLNLWKFHTPGLVLDETVFVECITLERLIQDHKLEKIDFIKIDTQGTDLSVLLSAGLEISKIMSCVLEFPYSKNSSLYSEEIDISEGIEELGKIGFSPVRIVPNGAGECNAFFLNTNYSIEDYFQMEKELGFNIAPTLKIGIHSLLINMTICQKFLTICLKLLTFQKDKILNLISARN